MRLHSMGLGWSSLQARLGRAACTSLDSCSIGLPSTAWPISVAAFHTTDFHTTDSFRPTISPCHSHPTNRQNWQAGIYSAVFLKCLAPTAPAKKTREHHWMSAHTHVAVQKCPAPLGHPPGRPAQLQGKKGPGGHIASELHASFHLHGMMGDPWPCTKQQHAGSWASCAQPNLGTRHTSQLGTEQNPIREPLHKPNTRRPKRLCQHSQARENHFAAASL